MADRIPLIVNPDASQIQELPTNDKLLLSGHLEFDSTNGACGDIISTGGSDANFGIYNSTSVSNNSMISIIGRNNANNGYVAVASFAVGANNVPSVSVASSGSFIGNGTIPLGGIIMWSGTGSATAVPTGFTLCDGNGGTAVNGITIPDLRDKFIVGANAVTGSDSTYPGVSMNQTGGSANAVLIAHTHTQTGGGTNDDGGSQVPGGPNSGTLSNINTTGVDADGNASTTQTGTNANLPPFLALAFIIRTS